AEALGCGLVAHAGPQVLRGAAYHVPLDAVAHVLHRPDLLVVLLAELWSRDQEELGEGETRLVGVGDVGADERDPAVDDEGGVVGPQDGRARAGGRGAGLPEGV